MMLAAVGNERVTASPGITTAVCPTCDEPVIPKCGKITVHHWAHRADTDCDTWSEGETSWHASWKQEWPQAKQEVRIGNHRADVLSATGVLEIQHSPISIEQILERERFYAPFSPYGNLAWLFDMTEPFVTERLEITTPRKPPRPAPYFSFRWKHARRSLAAIDGRLYLACDPDDDFVWHIRALYWHESGQVRGWGFRLETAEFLRQIDTVEARRPEPIKQYSVDDDDDRLYLRQPGTDSWRLARSPRPAKAIA